MQAMGTHLEWHEPQHETDYSSNLDKTLEQMSETAASNEQIQDDSSDIGDAAWLSE
jgi:hypothetical protein